MLLNAVRKQSAIRIVWKYNKSEWVSAFHIKIEAPKTFQLQQRRQQHYQLHSLREQNNINCHRPSALTVAIGYYTITRNISFFGIVESIKKYFSKMDDPKAAGAYVGVSDRFRGITVDSKEEHEDNVNFEEKLQKSLEFWEKNKKRTIWFHVHKEQSHWIPILIKYEFGFHHANECFVALKRWISKDESSNLPDYAHTLLGVGGLVINHDKMEVLVITDRFAAIPGSWKLPGGYVDPGENLIEAAKREVFEETGVECDFRSLVSVRHSHGGNFGCSDLYFVLALIPKTLELKPCEREIARAAWMPIAEYLQHPHVHETNRHFLRTYLDYERRELKIDCLTATHQILKKEYQLYYDRMIEGWEKVQVPSETDLKAQMETYANDKKDKKCDEV